MDERTRTDWRGGQLLAFSALDGPTDFDHGLVARTAFGFTGLEILIPDRGELRFDPPPDTPHWFTGDAFVWGSGPSRVRGAFVDAHHLLVEGPCVATGSERVRVLAENGRILIGVREHFRPDWIQADLDDLIRERTQWLRDRMGSVTVPEASRDTLCKMLSILKSQVCSPQGRIRHRWTTPDRWPHRKLWLWDSVFHAIGWRHLDPVLAREMISAVLDAQREDGFIPHMAAPDGHSDITQPPILAYGAALVNRVAPDPDWIAELYPRLCAYVRWDLAHRDTDGGGLVEWDIEGNPHCRSGESGMDNSPRFDDSGRLDAPDFNSFLALECECLARFARDLGRDADAEAWDTRRERLCEAIRERLWSDRHGLFMDLDVETGAHTEVLSSAGFLPLLCGAATPEQAARLAAHLRDPRTFGSPVPVPSVAVGDKRRFGGDMWRGPVWINLNWLIAEGLDRYGLGEPADDLRRRTVDLVDIWHERCGVSYEYYDALGETPPARLPRKGKCAPEAGPYHQAIHDYGWTATLYVDLVLGRGSTPSA